MGCNDQLRLSTQKQSVAYAQYICRRPAKFHMNKVGWIACFLLYFNALYLFSTLKFIKVLIFSFKKQSYNVDHQLDPMSLSFLRSFLINNIKENSLINQINIALQNVFTTPFFVNQLTEREREREREKYVSQSETPGKEGILGLHFLE